MREHVTDVVTEPLRVYFSDIHHGKGERSIYLYACLYEYETGDLAISADMPYCLKKIKERGWVVVKGAKPTRVAVLEGLLDSRCDICKFSQRIIVAIAPPSDAGEGK